MAEDDDYGPREGKSAISAETRRKLAEKRKKRGGTMKDKEAAPRKPVQVAEFKPDTSNPFAGNFSFQDLLSGLGGQPTQAVGATGASPAVQAQPQNTAQTELLKGMMQRWANPANQMIRPAEAYGAERAAAIGPVKSAQEQYQARLASDPWAKGGLFEGRTAAETMTPEAIMASQGNTAKNQWAQLGGVKGIDQEELERLNAEIAARRAGSYKSYV